MTIDSTELIRILPAMLQGRKKFAKMADGGNYHVGKVDEWCLSYADVVKGIEDFCEYKKTGKYTLSAPIDGNWNVLNAYQYEPQEREGNEMENRTTDMIHHPDHYTWKGAECKKVIEIMTHGLSGAEAYYMGNIIKYLYRYPKKGTLLSDLAKAEEYTKFLRELFIEDGGKPK